MSCDELPILPPALESIESSTSQQVVLVTNNNTPPNPSTCSNSHANAVQNVMRELADSKEHIDRTVLPSSHNFGGRPCLNMKEFFKLMTEKDKKQQNLDALYSLVEHDSDSIIGFVELNGLSFIDEWLDTARKENDYWFSLCILQFLAHNNLYITYQALQTAPIAKAVKQFINPNINNKVLSPQSLPRLTDKIRKILPNNLNISRANDNFTNVINRQIIHKIVYQHKDIPTIRYLQSQFASRIVNKWKKFVADWKKHNNRPLYRCIRYADEKGKPLISTNIFHLNDTPLTITQQRDKKRREKMITSIKWYHPNKIILQPLFESDSGQYSIERGKDSKEKKIQKERIMTELEEFAIGTDNLKNPKELISNKITPNNIKPTIIPLESEQTSPSPDKNINNTHAPHPHPHPHPHPPPGPGHPMNAPPYPHPHPHPHPPPPGPTPHGRIPYGYPPNLPPPHGHYIAPNPYHPQYIQPPPPPHSHGYPYPYVPPPPPYPYQQHPPQVAQAQVVLQAPQITPMQGQIQIKNNGVIDGKNRRRDFDGNDRPSKRQKIHDNRDYYERDNRRNHRKRHGKHRNKHDRKHKNRRGRNGRRTNKNGMHIFNRHRNYYTAHGYEYNIDYYYKQEQKSSEYFFIYFMFMFLAICYYIFGHKFGFIL